MDVTQVQVSTRVLFSSSHTHTHFHHLLSTYHVIYDDIPSRQLTYPTWGKGKSSSKCHFWGYVSLEGMYKDLFLFRTPLIPHRRFQLSDNGAGGGIITSKSPLPESQGSQSAGLVGGHLNCSIFSGVYGFGLRNI